MDQIDYLVLSPLVSNIDSIIYSSTHRSQRDFLKGKSSHGVHQLSTLKGFYLRIKAKAFKSASWFGPLTKMTLSPTTLFFASLVSFLSLKQAKHGPHSGPCCLLYPMPETLHSPSSKTHIST